MDKKHKLIYIGMGILLVVALLLVYFLLIKGEENYSIKTVVLDNCDNRAKLYYDDNTNKIYTYCLNNVKVELGNKEYELSTYLKDKKITIKDFFAKILKDETTWPVLMTASDGGTTIYDNQDINLIRCNRLSGEETIETNQDIFIGSKGMGFKNNYCQSDIKTITRTYKILKIEEIGEFEYKLTLEQYNKATATVVYAATKMEAFEENSTYEFEFLPYNLDAIEDTVEALFNDSLIISIYKTNKIGEEQIQEPISDLNPEDRLELVEKTKKTIFANEILNYAKMTSNYYFQFKIEDGERVPLCYIIDEYKDGYPNKGCMIMNYENDQIKSVHVYDDEYYYDGTYENLVQNKGEVVLRISFIQDTDFYVKGKPTLLCPKSCIDPLTRID